MAEEVSKELKVFRDLRPTMITAYGQEAVILRLTIACMSAGLISQALLNIDTNHETEATRSVRFVWLVLKNIQTAEKDGDLRKATDIIKKFAEILREVDSHYDDMASKIG